MQTGRQLIPTATPDVDYKIDVVRQLRDQRNVYPNVEDIEGRPISLAHVVQKFRGEGYPPQPLALIQQCAGNMEQDANSLLQKYTDKYGYHPLFRAGLREYFETRLVAQYGTFFSYLPPGASLAYLRYVQGVCLAAVESKPWLNTAEQRMFPPLVGAIEAEAINFWAFMTVNRLSYLAMQDMIVKLDQKAEAGEPYDALMLRFEAKKDARSGDEADNSSGGKEN